MSRNLIHPDKEVEKLKLIQEPLDDKCSKLINNEIKFCSRAGQKDNCTVYAFPSKKWRIGDCPMSDDFLRTKVEDSSQKTKTRVGQQKQKKKSRR